MMPRAAGREGAALPVAARAKLGAVAIALALGSAGGAAAQAQAPMSEERCKAIMTIVSGVVYEYRGQISTDFISDLQKKIGSNGKCDGPDEYRLWPNTKDREALGRIRTILSTWDACQREPSQEGCK
jgi:hypothetical protein